MQQVRIVDLIIKNFRSFHAEEICISRQPGLKYLGGDNQTEPRLGANGAGKSSMWESICWCLYGRSIRGARTSNVISWGQEDVMVAVVLEIDGVEVTVLRFGPPERMEIHKGEASFPATQKDIDTLIGLSLDRFLHSVIFGQGKKLFPDLTITERGELFDEVLDLDLWTRCGDEAGTESKRLAVILDTHRMELGRANGLLDGIPTDESIQAQESAWEVTKASQLQTLGGSATKWDEEQNTEIAQELDKAERWLLEMQSLQNSTQKRASDWTAEHDAVLESYGAELEVLEVKVAGLLQVEQTQLDPYESNTARQALWNKRTSLELLRKLETQKEQTLKILNENLAAWSETRECGSCGQPVTVENAHVRKAAMEVERHKQESEFSAVVTETAQAAADLFVLEADYNLKAVAFGVLQEAAQKASQECETATQAVKLKEEMIAAHIGQANPYTEQLQTIADSKNPHLVQIRKIEAQVNPYQAQIEATMKWENPHTPALYFNRIQREQATIARDAAASNALTVEGQIAAVEFWKTGFKRIRLYFVQKILEALQIEIQSAISALGLQGWKILLATETENKSGTMKLGVQITIESSGGQVGAWETWSGGESQRLRLSMGMGLAALIQRAAGVWFDIEVWDEPSAWLSDIGIEDLLEALRYRADINKKQIWIVDHRALSFSGFKEIWSVKKGEEGSKLFKVSEATV